MYENDLLSNMENGTKSMNALHVQIHIAPK